MTLRRFREHARRYSHRVAFTTLFRGPLRIRSEIPLISFTFDDFPRSAYQVGGAILSAEGLRGTYYTALGLMGKHTAVGEMFSREDLRGVVANGHELGCHTYDHHHAWNTSPAAFERSIVENACHLNDVLPGASFKTHAYPISAPRPFTKRRASRHFPCCRFGGQTYNAGTVDRYLLFAYFLEQSAQNFNSVKTIIDRNAVARGWLIFATHDVSEPPTRFGCRPLFFERVVRYASHSGATVLPVGEAWNLVSGERRGNRNTDRRDQSERT